VSSVNANKFKDKIVSLSKNVNFQQIAHPVKPPAWYLHFGNPYWCILLLVWFFCEHIHKIHVSYITLYSLFSLHSSTLKVVVGIIRKLVYFTTNSVVTAH
jgi:hypothetical protein